MKSRTKARSIALQVLYEIDLAGHPAPAALDERLSDEPMDQVAIIDRNILRIALWEFAVAEVTPIKVAINEAIEMAKIYGSDSTPRFVNGVLGSLADRQEEIQKALGSPESK